MDIALGLTGFHWIDKTSRLTMLTVAISERVGRMFSEP
jgi:hypothetical protein